MTANITNNEPLGGDIETRIASAIRAVTGFPDLKNGDLSLAAELRAALSQQAGAAGASEVKPWQERTDEITPTAVVMAMEQEIADLRAQLALQRQKWEAEFDTLAKEAKSLHDALCFWLPKVPEGLEGPILERICADAYLLVGYDDMPDKYCAEELSWITLNARQRQSECEPVAYCAPDKNGKPLFGKGWMFSPVHQMQATLPLYLGPAAQAQGEPVAWITFRTKDGRETLKEGCVATNRAYTEAHSQWVWEPLGRLVKPAAQADEVRDTARYRWLCDTFGITKLPVAIERLLDGGYGATYVADGKAGIDAAIDKAMRTTAADNQKGDSNA